MRAKTIAPEMLLEALENRWTVQELARAAGCSHHVVVRHLRLAGMRLPRQHRQRTVGYEGPRAGDGFTDNEQHRLTVYTMGEVERRRLLLRRAKTGDTEAAAVLQRTYHLTVIEVPA